MLVLPGISLAQEEVLSLKLQSCEPLTVEDVAPLVLLEIDGSIKFEIDAEAQISIQCQEQGTVRITLQKDGLEAFSRESPIADASEKGRARFIALATAEFLHDWKTLQSIRRAEAKKELPPPTDVKTSEKATRPMLPPPVEEPWSRRIHAYLLGTAGGLPGLPWGVGVRWNHRPGSSGGGYGVDLQTASTTGEATLGGFRARTHSLGVAYVHSWSSGEFTWLTSAGARGGVVRFDGDSSRDDVTVQPFWLPFVGPQAAAGLSWHITHGLCLGIGLEFGAPLLSASADLGMGERADGSNLWGQLELGAGWQW